MSVDPEAPAQSDTPTPAETQAEIDWRKRYEDLQPEYTRKSQAAADYERLRTGQDPDALKQILDAYGYELDDNQPEDPAPYEEPDTFQQQPVADPRIDQFEQFMQSQQAKEEQQQRIDEWDGWKQYISEKAKAEGVDLTDRELKALQVDSVDQNGYPIPQAQADQVLSGHLEWRNSFIEDAVKQRRRPRAPHVPAGGQPDQGSEREFKNDNERVRYMMDRLQAEAG